ncbi:MAG: 4Fe-4S dicluster domain-containing protein [Deltaproteobacteria bacterium]|nr:MAG: 4Fe-4S dicluster domain-containing protein [Deltaproteobacteria bacterium]
MKRVYPREENCMGCGLCLVACVVEHSKTKDILMAYKQETPRPTPRNVVEEGEEGACFSLQCRHCQEPDCVDACVNGALYIDNGVIKVNKDHCVACWMCVMACPYGCIYREEREGSWNSNKCDLCPGRDVPACVEICPNRALVYEER